MRPKKISVRPSNELEGGGIIVWVYHRKVQIQLRYPDGYGTDAAINDTMAAWEFAMREVS